MAWTDRPDDTACCGPDPGPIQAGEIVARLLHSKIEIPETAAFKRDQLQAPEAGHDDTCGNADGCSIVRRDALTDDELRNRAEAIAAMGKDRVGRGAATAAVDALRAIQCDFDPRKRAVYVYDDPMTDNAAHAVMRVSSCVPRSDFDEVRTQILQAFSGRVTA